MTALLALAVLALASVTAYFAVFGLSALAPAVPYSMIALGLSLEFGKYVSLTYVYANWSSLPFKLKAVTTTILIAVLMLTSIGVFGYLQSAFSSSLAESETKASQLQVVSRRVLDIEAEIRSIDLETKRVPDGAVRSRIALLREYEQRRSPLVTELQTLRQQEGELRSAVLQTRAHTGPLSYVASALNVPLDTAVFWMAVLLTVSLDPMAIALSLLLVYARTQSKVVNEVQQPVAAPDEPMADPETPEIFAKEMVDDSELATDLPDDEIRQYEVSFVYEAPTPAAEPEPAPEPSAVEPEPPTLTEVVQQQEPAPTEALSALGTRIPNAATSRTEPN